MAVLFPHEHFTSHSLRGWHETPGNTCIWEYLVKSSLVRYLTGRTVIQIEVIIFWSHAANFSQIKHRRTQYGNVKIASEWKTQFEYLCTCSMLRQSSKLLNKDKRSELLEHFNLQKQRASHKRDLVILLHTLIYYSCILFSVTQTTRRTLQTTSIASTHTTFRKTWGSLVHSQTGRPTVTWGSPWSLQLIRKHTKAQVKQQTTSWQTLWVLGGHQPKLK